MEKSKPSYTVGGYEMMQPLWKTVGSSSKSKTELPYDPAIPLLLMYPKEFTQNLDTNIHSSIVYNNQKRGTT